MRFPFAREKALTGSSTVVEALADRRANFIISLGGSQAGRERINAAFLRGNNATYGWLYSNRPAVRTVIDYIARNVAQLPLKLYERLDETKRERDTEHPAIKTMDTPGGGVPDDQFIFRVVADYLVFDVAYILKFRRSNGGPLELVRLPPAMVLVSGGRFTADFFRVYRVDGTFFDVQPDDMIHWHGYNPDDPLLGISKLETLRDTLTEDQVSQAATVELYKSGLKGGHFERPLEAPDWSEEARQRFQEGWRNQTSGSPRLTPVAEEGMKFVQDAMTPKDAELLASRRFTVEEVARVYGLPLEVLSLSQTSSALEQARMQVNADVLPPITTTLAGQLDQDILVTEYDATDYYFEFDLNEKMRGDPVARFASMTAAAGRPWRTVNEVRALDNLPEIDGGDELTIPLNVALGELPAPNVMPPQDPNGPPQDGSHREPPGTPPGPPEPKALVKTSQPLVQLHPRRAADLSRQQRYIDEAKGMLDGFYARQARILRRKALEFDGARWDRELSQDLNDLLSSIVEREGGIYVARLMGDDFDMRQVKNYLRVTTEEVARAINDVTQQDIADVGLDDAMARARGMRAGVAATSLAARSTVFARMEAAKQAPQYELRTKTWIADTERHAEFDGQTVPIGDDWPAGFAPGSQPNCGCSASIN